MHCVGIDLDQSSRLSMIPAVMRLAINYYAVTALVANQCACQLDTSGGFGRRELAWLLNQCLFRGAAYCQYTAPESPESRFCGVRPVPVSGWLPLMPVIAKLPNLLRLLTRLTCRQKQRAQSRRTYTLPIIAY